MTAHSESTTLGVRQAKRPRAQGFSEDPILLPEIVDQIVLVTVHPASEREDEELQRRRHSLRLLGRLDQHRPSLGRFFAPYGMGTVIVELELGADARKVVDEVKSSVDAITTFPVEAEKPIIRELTRRMQVADISVFGDVDLFTLKATAERVRDELTAIPGITQVEIVSAPPYEISIEVSELTLRRHGLTFDQIADAVRRSSLDLPGGSVRTEGGEILLRTIGQAYRGTEYENLVLWTRADGSRRRCGRPRETVVKGRQS